MDDYKSMLHTEIFENAERDLSQPATYFSSSLHPSPLSVIEIDRCLCEQNVRAEQVSTCALSELPTKDFDINEKVYTASRTIDTSDVHSCHSDSLAGLYATNQDRNSTAIHFCPEMSSTDIHAHRNGSAASLLTDNRGVITVNRRFTSETELIDASLKKMNTTTLPTIMSLMSQKTEPDEEPLLDAEDALERLGGKGAKGAYSEHMMNLENLGERFETHIDPTNASKSKGLTTEKAAEVLEEFGPNVLTPPPRVPLWLLFLLQFTSLLMVLIEVTGLACFILYAIDQSDPTNLYVAVLLYVVLIVTCYETFSQEAKSDSLMEKFRALVPEAASVIRDGVLKPIGASEIVIGDVIVLKSGDKIPADCRVIHNQSMKVDQSMITGESESVDIRVHAVDSNSLEARNIIFSGSLVVDGGGMAVVIRTGDATLIGNMVELTGNVGKCSSTLKADLEHFVKSMTFFALIQSMLIFVVGIARGLNPLDCFIQGFVVILIGNVPQGLPTTVTACLLIIAERMGKQNVFVKKLDVIETLGSCTLICTDKTGTLTQNLMSVAHAWFFDCKFDTELFTKTNAEEKSQQLTSSQLRTLIDVASLNSRVALEMKPTKRDPKIEELTPTADATELGLYRYFGECIQERMGMNIEEYRAANPKVWEIPFNSANKWQMSIHSLKSLDGRQLLLLKGAPDVLLTKCSHYLTVDGTTKPIDEVFSSRYTDVYEEYGGNGERVLGFAMRPMPRTVEEEEALDPKYKVSY
jgi:sodium/potassium-transporting ATPase subunit alpha